MNLSGIGGGGGGPVGTTGTGVTLVSLGGRIDDGVGGRKAVHFQEYWVRLRAAVPAHAVVPVGAEQASPAPGVLEAIAAADVVLFPPSNPVVSVGTILSVPGIREAIAGAGAPTPGGDPRSPRPGRFAEGPTRVACPPAVSPAG